MIIDDQNRDEKLQYDISREAAKIWVLSSGKIDKYENLTGEEILPSDQQKIIEQGKLLILPWEKLLKTNKNNWRSRRKASWDFKRFKTKRTNKSNWR